MEDGEENLVTPGELLGESNLLIAGRGAYTFGRKIYASLSGRRRITPPVQGSPEKVCLSHSRVAKEALVGVFFYQLHCILFRIPEGGDRSCWTQGLRRSSEARVHRYRSSEQSVSALSLIQFSPKRKQPLFGLNKNFLSTQFS